MIDDLLQFSRVVQQTGETFGNVNIKPIIEEAVEDLEALIASKNPYIMITGDYLPVSGNHSLLKQVFQNLIQNAIKFSKPDIAPRVIVHGQIITPDTKSFISSEKPSYQQIIVSDNGIGFDIAHSDRIFGMFQRLNGRSEYEGSGIGLSICKKIVEAHNGIINAEAQLDNGATINISLPLT